MATKFSKHEVTYEYFVTWRSDFEIILQFLKKKYKYTNGSEKLKPFSSE